MERTTRRWLVGSLCATAAAAGYAVATATKPASDFDRPVYSEAVARQMLDPLCARFRQLTPDHGLSADTQPEEVRGCIEFIDYRTSGIYGMENIPNTPEGYRARVASLQALDRGLRRGYYVRVLGLPLAVLFGSLAVFFVTRTMAHRDFTGGKK